MKRLVTVVSPQGKTAEELAREIAENVEKYQRAKAEADTAPVEPSK